MLLGRVTLPAGHPRAGSDYPIYGYLIDHPDGLVLVDTGVDAGHPWLDEHYSPASLPIHSQLAGSGAGVDQVAMVINTHLHFDHIGNNPRFPDVPLVAQRAEYEAAGAEGYTVPAWLDFPGARWLLIDGEEEVLPGISVFPTPSHTVGHQSVAVTTDRGLELVAGQALHNREELAAEQSAEQPGGSEEYAAVARSLKARRPAAVWFSHDHRPWPAES